MPTRVPLFKRLKQVCSNQACLLNHRYREVFWLLGDGRSGTSWIARLLNNDGLLREIFEPCHPWEVDQAQGFGANLYVPPGASQPELQAFYDQVFSGRLSSPSIDRNNKGFWYNGLLVKDIFANLLASWACQQFPQVQPVLVIRNPFAVAASKRKTRHWHWPASALDYFADPRLVADFLRPFDALAEHIQSKNDYLLIQIFNWCVIHYVLFRQLDFSKVPVVFYENMFMQPENQIDQLKTRLGMPPSSLDIASASVVSRQNFRTNRALSKQHPLVHWYQDFTDIQLSVARTILNEFGLSHVYPDQIMPAAEPWLQTSARREVYG